MHKRLIIVLLLSLIFILPTVTRSDYSVWHEIKKKMSTGNFVNSQLLWVPKSIQYYLDSVGSNIYPCAPPIVLLFYKNPTLSFDGKLLKSQDRVCTGDILNLNDVDMSGEFVDTGSTNDSPPVVFTDDLNRIIEEIEAKTYEEEKLYMQNNFPILYTVICSKNCSLTKSEGLKRISENMYKVIGTGELKLEITCTPECIQFVDTPEGTSGGYPKVRAMHDVYGYCNGVNREFAEWPDNNRLLDLAREKEELKPEDIQMFPNRTIATVIGRSFTLHSNKSYMGPDVEARVYAASTQNKGKLLFRVEVENSGDMAAFIEGVKLNAPYRVLYSPVKLAPGERSEILVTAEMEQSQNLEAEISISSETAGCLESKYFSVNAALGTYGTSEGCSLGSDCPIGQTCCTGLCRDQKTGVCDDIDGDGEPDTWVEV